MSKSFRVVARGSGDLKTRYRPQRLSEIIPTFPKKEARAILENPNASSVYIFEGLSGTGKTSLARILARASICESTQYIEKPCLECSPCLNMERSPDYTEINVADLRRIDDVRDQIAGMRYHANYLKRRIYVFDEVHQLTPASQELLNKVLEEPIGDVLIFLCTTHKKGLKRTLLSRCLPITFRRVTRAQSRALVEQLVVDMGQPLPANNVLDAVTQRADGSVRDLLNLTEKVLLGTFSATDASSISEEHCAPANLIDLVNHLIDKNWFEVSKALKSENIKNDPEGYRQAMCNILRARSLSNNSKVNLPVATVMGHLTGSLHDETRPEQYNILVLRCMRACYKNLSNKTRQ